MSFTPKNMVKKSTAELGYLEKKSNKDLDDKKKNAGNKNYTKYNRDLDTKGKGLLNGKKQPSDYCANLHLWLVCECLDWDLAKVRKALYLPKTEGGKPGCSAAGAKYFANYFKAKGKFDNKPEIGCPVFFDTKKKRDGTPTHVGTVVEITDKQIKTIEGNTKKLGKGGVWPRTYSKTNAKIVGYGHPKFDKETTEKPKDESAAPTKMVKATGVAEKKSEALNKTFKVKTVTADIKNTPNASSKTLCTVKKGTSLRCFGFYSVVKDVEWIFVQYIDGDTVYQGFVCGKGVS
ncbi:MAG: hypothetical protein IKF29_00630 [Oceanobacillus sp.]|nr:hypothetical protein [Oceanobacillus sp.]